MINSWLTYLFVLSLVFFTSCGSAEYAPDKSFAKEDEVAKVDYMEEAATETAEAEEYFEEMKESVEEITEGIEAILDYEQEVVLEERAIQKVQDLFDYVGIMSNTEYDMELRRNSMKMAVDLFESKASLIAPSLTHTDDTLRVRSVLKDVLKGKINVENIEVVRVGMNRELNEEVISCSLKLNEEEVVLWFYVNMEFETKQFGNTSQEVWSVYLGDVKEY